MSSAFDWRAKAACRDKDPELFFPVGNTGAAYQQIEEAKAVCRTCKVIDACLKCALDTNQDYGVWGGLSEDERRALKRRAMRASAVELLSADLNMVLDRVEKKYELATEKTRAFRVEAIKAYNGLAMSQGRENLLRNVPEVWRKAVELTNKAGIVKVGDADQLYVNTYIDAASK